MSQTETYYDGQAFVGLELGQADLGNIARARVKRDLDSDYWIETARMAYDTHGNVVELLEPLAEVGGHTHQRRYLHSDDGLRVIQADVLLEDPEGEPYTLHREVTFESLFDKQALVTAWMRMVDNTIVSTRRSTSFEYDVFGRMMARYYPGNLSAEPDETYTYDLANPASRIITEVRTEQGGELDQVSVRCMDGLGRTFQSRTLHGPGDVQVSGLTVYNIRSSPAVVYQSYPSSSLECDTEAPPGTLSNTYRYDAMGRELLSTLPDAQEHGTSSSVRRVYAPLTAYAYDFEDNDPDSPFYNTPKITRLNGQNRVASYGRLLEEGGAEATVSLQYDGLGRLTHVSDPMGNTKEQEFDLMGRLLVVRDPNSEGETTFEYDDASQIIRSTDDRGIVTINVYDGMSRTVATYDEADREGTLIETVYDHDPECPSCVNLEGGPVSISYPWWDGSRGMDRMSMDVRERLTRSTRTLGGVEFVTEFGYDNSDRVRTVTYPDGTVIEMDYSAGNRMLALNAVDRAQVVSQIDYDERDQMARVEYGSGSSLIWAYDSVLQVAQMSLAAPGGEMLQGWSYSRDRNGNLWSVNDIAQRPGAPITEAEFSYDAWYRVVEAAWNPGAVDEERVSLTYDLLDNITSRVSTQDGSVSHVGSYAYDSYAPNALTEAGGVTYAYDEAGHMRRRGDQEYRWDYQERMTEVWEGDEQVARYTYGPNQSRLAKQDSWGDVLYIAGDFEVRDGISTLYVRLGRHRVARLESDALAADVLGDPIADGQVNAADAWASRDDDPERFTRSAVRRLLVDSGPDDGVAWLHQDHLGSITLATGLVDGTHEVLGQRAFDGLGSVRAGEVGYVDEY
ncbi:MAG: hypothetical protein AAFX99_27935, partial [Myxococcota bacterium]